MSASRLLSSALVALAAVGAAPAQRPTPAAGPGTGEPLAASGSDWHAVFDGEGVRFWPLRRPGDAPAALSLRLLSVGRRDAPGPVLPRVQPTASGDTFEFPRPSVLERYTARNDGLEQSFVLDALPPGHGDLVLRVRCATDLLRPDDTEQTSGLRFGGSGALGVTVGAVTGIDALGNRAGGALRCTGSAIELILPSAFVDTAALPLVVDPLIGSSILLAVGGDHPDAAWNATFGLYAVVWRQQTVGGWYPAFSLLDAAGFVIVGGSLVPAGQPPRTGGTRIRIAGVSKRDAFVCAWDTGTTSRTLSCAALHAGTWQVSPVVPLASGIGVGHPDVGGESTDADDDAIVVWSNDLIGTVTAIEVGLSVLGAPATPTPGTPHVLNTPVAGVGAPSIPQTGGALGRYLIAWTEPSSTGASTAVIGTVVNRNLNVLVPPFAIAPMSRSQPQAPSVDGDGERWLVAYESSGPEIRARTVDVPAGQSTAMVSDDALVAAAGFLTPPPSQPAVAWLSDSYLVGFMQGPSGIGTAGMLASVDPYNCAHCEGAWTLTASTLSVQPDTMVVSRHPNSRDAADALVVYVSQASGLSTQVQARRYVAEDGLTVSAGGGCGNGGDAAATCGLIGNASFEHRLRRATPGAATFLAYGTARLDASCGTCTLVPDPAAGGGLLFAGLTDGGGNAAYGMPIPNVSAFLGAVLYDQWVTFTPGAACSVFQVDLSTALRLTVQ